MQPYIHRHTRPETEHGKFVGTFCTNQTRKAIHNIYTNIDYPRVDLSRRNMTRGPAICHRSNIVSINSWVFCIYICVREWAQSLKKRSPYCVVSARSPLYRSRRRSRKTRGAPYVHLGAAMWNRPFDDDAFNYRARAMSVIELDRQTVVCKRDAVGQIGGRG